MRIGHGYDAHRLAGGRKLILGGVEIPYAQGLDGHSDADVLLHALADAILGAAALGDIGKLFPDSADWTAGMDSIRILKGAADAAADAGFSVENCDCTIVAQRPKLAPYIETMRRNMGFTGREEGMAAHAVVLLR